MHAVEKGNIDAVRILAPHEAGVQDKIGRTALVRATVERVGGVNVSADIVELLANHETEIPRQYAQKILVWAAKPGNATIIDTLLKHQLILDQIGKQDNDGRTAIMYASDANNIEAVRILAQHEARMQDNSGRTDLMCAVCDKDVDELQDLLEVLSDDPEWLEKEVGQPDNDGCTVLMHAVENKHSAIIHALLEALIKYPELLKKVVGQKDKNGCTDLCMLRSII